MGTIKINIRARKTDMNDDYRWTGKDTKRYRNAFANHVGVKTYRKALRVLKHVSYRVSRPDFSTVVISY